MADTGKVAVIGTPAASSPAAETQAGVQSTSTGTQRLKQMSREERHKFQLTGELPAKKEVKRIPRPWKR